MTAARNLTLFGAGATAEQRHPALEAADPLGVPHVADALARLDEVLARVGSC